MSTINLSFESHIEFLSFIPFRMKDGEPVPSLSVEAAVAGRPSSNYLTTFVAIFSFNCEEEAQAVFSSCCYEIGRFLEESEPSESAPAGPEDAPTLSGLLTNVTDALRCTARFPGSVDREAIRGLLQRLDACPRLRVQMGEETEEIQDPVDLVDLVETMAVQGSDWLLASCPSLFEAAAHQLTDYIADGPSVCSDGAVSVTNVASCAKALDALFCSFGRGIDLLSPCPEQDLPRRANAARSVMALRSLNHHLRSALEEVVESAGKFLEVMQDRQMLLNLCDSVRSGLPPPLEPQSLLFALLHPELFTPDQRGLMLGQRGALGPDEFCEGISDILLEPGDDDSLHAFTLNSISQVLAIPDACTRPLSESHMVLLEHVLSGQVMCELGSVLHLRGPFSSAVSPLDAAPLSARIRDLLSSLILDPSTLSVTLPKLVASLVKDGFPEEGAAYDLFQLLHLVPSDPVLALALRPHIRPQFFAALRTVGPNGGDLRGLASFLISYGLFDELRPDQRARLFNRTKLFSTAGWFNRSVYGPLYSAPYQDTGPKLLYQVDGLLQFIQMDSKLAEFLFASHLKLECPDAFSSFFSTFPSFHRLSKAQLLDRVSCAETVLRGTRGICGIYDAFDTIRDALTFHLTELSKALLGPFLSQPLGTDALLRVCDLLVQVQRLLSRLVRYSSFAIRDSARLCAILSRLPQLSPAEAKKLRATSKKIAGQHERFLQSISRQVLPALHKLKRAVDVQWALRDPQLVGVF